MSQDKQPRTRSPNYPGVSLEKAIQLAKEIFAKVKRHATSTGIIAKTWELSEKSGVFNVRLGALRAFGLLENVPNGTDKMVKLTDLAFDIVADYPEGSPGWKSAVQRAALAPGIHDIVRSKYGPSLPDDDEVRRFLVREKKFNDSVVSDFISEYKATMAFSGLGGNDKIADEGGADEDSFRVEIGDFVQWVSQGVDQFVEPRRITGISDDGQWVFIEGSQTGVPVKQVMKAQKNPDDDMHEPSPLEAPKSDISPPINPRYKQESETSNRPYIRFPLSATNTVEIRLNERMSAEDFVRLRKLLELSESSLVDQSIRK